MLDCGSRSSRFKSRYLPLMFWNLKSHCNISNNLFFLLVKWIIHFKKWFFTNFKLPNNLNLLLLNNIYLPVNFKIMFFSLLNPKTTKNMPYKSFKTSIHQTWSKKLYLTYVKLNSGFHQNTLQPHSSQQIYYYLNKQLNIGILNITKLINVWHNILTFIENIFFYSIEYLIFANNYFKYESLSLNWKKLSLIKSFWRYTYPFIFFLNNKTTQKTELYFRFLLQKGFRVSFVIDIFYHKKTIFYFNKLKFISIGPVPISSNLYLLNLSLPVNSNSIFSNLFFIRFLLKLKKKNSKLLYQKFM